MSKPIDIKIDQDLDFDVIRQDWNKYELGDGTVLKAMNVTSKVFRLKERDQMGRPSYFAIGQNVVAAISPIELRGTPSTEPFQPTEPMDDISFVALREAWNEYDLADGTLLKVKLVVSQVVVSPTKKNQFGEPIYMINSTTVLSTTIPDSLKYK